MSKEKRLQAVMCEITADISILTIEKVKGGLVALADKIDKWCYLLHDKDTKDDGTPIHTHYHVYLHFKRVIDFNVVKKAFGVELSNIQFIHDRYDTACLYLVHKYKPEKFQYNPEDVAASFDYPLFLKNTEKKMTREAKLKQLREGIENGTIKRFNIDEYVTMDEFDKYKKNIENYFKYIEIQRKKQHKRKQCIFIHRESGCGKTWFAKEFAKSKGLSFCASGSSNDPLEEYKGEDVLILDDLRGSSFSFSDLIKLLDNDTSTSVKSRYYNKLLECDYIIITTVLPLEEFYINLFEHEKEPITQLRRRCPIYIDMDKEWVNINKFNKNTELYEFQGTVRNKCPFLKVEHSDYTSLVADLLAFGRSNYSTIISMAPKLSAEDFHLLVSVLEAVANDIEAIIEAIFGGDITL